MRKKNAPALVYKDFATSDQVIRDLFTIDIKRLVVDDKNLYKRISSYIKDVNHEQSDKLELYKRNIIIDYIFYITS